MEPLAARHIIEHISDLQREASAARAAAAATAAGRRRSHTGTPKVAIRWASTGLMFIATRLDPNLGRPSYGRE